MASHISKKVEMEDRYQKATQIMSGFFNKSVIINSTVFPTWNKNGSCFWYIRDINNGGQEYRLVNAIELSNRIAFNHQELAAALAKVSEEEVSAEHLSLSNLDFGAAQIVFEAFGQRWSYDEEQNICTKLSDLDSTNEVTSPNGKWSVYQKDYNLWLRNLETGAESQLTVDGQEHFVYGAPSTAWGFVNTFDELQVSWSPDSLRIFTIQRDTRDVLDYPLIEHVPADGSIRPKLNMHKIPLPGDKHVETVRLLSIDVMSGEQQAASYNQVASTRNGFGFFTANLGWWGKESRLAYFVDVDRYYKSARLVEFDTHTGACKVLFEESSDTQINLMNNSDMWPSFVPMPDTDELLWYSERSGWAHLYLYDLQTGTLKNRVTDGEWLVREIVTVIPQKREVFIQRGCHNSEQNPYYRDLIRVNIDTSEVATVISGDYDIFAGAFTDMTGLLSGSNRKSKLSRGTAPSGMYSVVTRSRVDRLPETFLLDRDGNELMRLEEAALIGVPEDWCYPESVKMLSADGKTDIFGVMYYPSGFVPEKIYPVIHLQYNTPDFPFAPHGGFDVEIFDGQCFYTCASLAELGFIVVVIDGRGSSYRSKAFQDVSYGNMQQLEALADQVEGLKELATKRPYMDMSKLGVFEPVGGHGVLSGMLDYPDFYKVGVVNIPHDVRLMAAPMWGDMFEGPAPQTNSFAENKVAKLKGKLLLTSGMLDVCTTPAIMFRLIEALHKANKDFDMLLLPKLGHGPSEYIIRRSWDYFVKHLMNEEPPKEYLLSDLFG